MKLRTLSLTVAVLAAACLAVYFLQRPPPPAPPDARVSQPVLDAALAARAAQLQLADNGKTVTLKKLPDGTWQVTDYFDLPADFAKLSRFIGDLTDAKVQRLVTSRPDRLARLEFKATTISLLDGAGKDLWQVTLGKNAEGGGRYLRFGSEEKGYQAGLNAWLDTEPKNWADATLLNLKPTEIARVEVGFTGETTTITAVRAKPEDPWTAAAPAGKRLKANRVNSLVSSLASLRFTETALSDDANAITAHAHQRIIKLTTFDQKSYAITLSRKPEEKKLKPPAAAPGGPASPPAANLDTPPAVAPAAAPGGPASPPAALPDATPVANASPAISSAPTPVTAPATGPIQVAAPAKPAEPEFETIPAGPVFVAVASSDAGARINDFMKKRAFQVGEWTFTGLPAAAADLWEDVPAPAPVAAPSAPGPVKDSPPAKP